MTRRLRDLEKPSRLKDALRAIAGIQVRHPFLTMAAVLAVTILLIGGIAQVRTVASLEQMMPRDVPEITAFNDLRDAGLGQDMLAVVISIDPDAREAPGEDILAYGTYTYVRDLKARLAREDLVLTADGFSDVVEAAAAQAGIQVTPATYDALIADSRVKEALAQFVNPDRTVTTILLSTDVSADDLRMNLLADAIAQDVTAAGQPPGARIAITGTPVIQQRLGEVIEHDRKLTERLSALFVFILVAMVFGSVIAAFVPMASIILSIIWLYGMMGYLGLPISTLAGGVAAMVIGIGVDYSIHLRNKFEYERKKGESLEYAVEETMGNTGYVLTTVTITTGLAFLAFMLGDMPEMGRFGLLMAMGVTLAFILSVIGLPALFIIEERIIYWVKGHVRFGVEHELSLTTATSIARKNERELTRKRKEAR